MLKKQKRKKQIRNSKNLLQIIVTFNRDSKDLEDR